jgi:hypothetical protein
MGVVADKAHAQHKKVFLLLFVHKKKPSLPLPERADAAGYTGLPRPQLTRATALSIPLS